MWIVAMDGSHLSYRCLRLASMLMDVDNASHHILALNISEGGKTNSLLASNTQEEVRKCGVSMQKFAFKTIGQPEKLSVAQTLVAYVNNCSDLKVRLVLGAQGMRYDDITGVPVMDHIGSVAGECMERVKAPVIVVKQPWRELEGQRNPLGRVQRCGRNGKPGLNLFVCVDDSGLSKQAFNVASKMLRPGDSLVALHVRRPPRDSYSQERENKLRDSYTQSCSQLQNTIKGLESCKYIEVPRTNNSIGEDILEFTDVNMADVIIMSSEELGSSRSQQLGSVSLFVAKHAKPHVCIIKHAE